MEAEPVDDLEQRIRDGALVSVLIPAYNGESWIRQNRAQ
jgi:hypothetical protein